MVNILGTHHCSQSLFIEDCLPLCVCVCVCVPRSVSVLLVAVLTWGLSALLIAVTPLTPIRSHYHPREDRYRLLYLIS